MAPTDWALKAAPLYCLPENRRLRLALPVPIGRTYSRPGGVKVHMEPDHFIVWSSWTIGRNGKPRGKGLPAYVPRDTWDKTYKNERPAQGGHVWADKFNMVRAARYTGAIPIRILVNENDPASPETWAIFGPGDHVVLAVDDRGEPMTYIDANGIRRFDQYPIHGDNWEAVGWEPAVPLPAGMEPTIARQKGPVVLAPVAEAESPGGGGQVLL